MQEPIAQTASAESSGTQMGWAGALIPKWYVVASFKSGDESNQQLNSEKRIPRQTLASTLRTPFVFQTFAILYIPI